MTARRHGGEEAAAVTGGLSLLAASLGHLTPAQAGQRGLSVRYQKQPAPSGGWQGWGCTQRLHLGVQRTPPGATTCCCVDRSTKIVGNVRITLTWCTHGYNRKGVHPGELALPGEGQRAGGYLAGWKGWVYLYVALQRLCVHVGLEFHGISYRWYLLCWF